MTNLTLKYYDRNAQRVTREYETIDMSILHQKLLNFFPRKSTLLELGSGSGRDAVFLLAQGYNVHTTDGSQSMLTHALRLHPELKDRQWYLQLPGEFRFPDNSYDGVYAIAVLMHFEYSEIEEILQEVYRVLKEHGRLVYSVPMQRAGLQTEGIDQHGRKYLILPKGEWSALNESFNFHTHSTFENDDVRLNIRWCSFFLEKNL